MAGNNIVDRKRRYINGPSLILGPSQYSRQKTMHWDWICTTDLSYQKRHGLKGSDIFEKWTIPDLFPFIFVFLLQLILNKFDDDWIQTADLRCWKQPHYQLSHNHCPSTIRQFFLKKWAQHGHVLFIFIPFTWQI